MIAPECILKAFDNSNVYDAIQKHRVTDEKTMPWAYQRANPDQRFLHGDWSIFKDTPRQSTAYNVPLPFKQVQGACAPQWMMWDPNYPASPGLQTEVREDGRTYALIDCAVEGSGYATFAVWLDGKWVPCFQTYRKVIFGKLLAHYTGGLKQDVTVVPMPGGLIKSDIMGWWDPPSLSYNKIS